MVLEFRNKVKKHTPKVALHSIRSLIVGGYKSGKTRLWKEVTELHYESPEEALLIAFEKGYETWELENVLPIHEEGEPYEVWEYFRSKLVKGLVQEAKDNKTVKLIGIDTADKAIAAAEAWVINDVNKRKASKFTSLQEIGDKTSDNGYTLLVNEMNKQFDALENAGYGLMSLAWTKEKETTLYNGLKYNSLELMMSATGKKVFESQASLICTLFNEVKIYDREGNVLTENIKDKKEKDKATNFHSTQVVMVFRPNEFVSIGGGRYVNLPDEPVPYDSKGFMRVYEEAVKGQIKNPEINNIKVIEAEQEKENDIKGKEYAEKEETKASAEDLVALIEVETKRFTPNDLTVRVVPKFTELLGSPNFRKATDVDLLTKALSFIKELVTV